AARASTLRCAPSFENETRSAMSSPRGATSSTRPSPNTGWRMRSPTLKGASTRTAARLFPRRLDLERLESAASALTQKRQYLHRPSLPQVDARDPLADRAQDLVAQGAAPGRDFLDRERGTLLCAEQHDLVAHTRLRMVGEIDHREIHGHPP